MSDEGDDCELLERWRRGDNGAGSRLVKRHFDAMHRFFASKAHSHTEDLIQQTFMACVEAKGAFRGDCSFRAYLFGIARFQLLTHYRKISRTRGFHFTAASVRDLGTSPTGDLLRREELELVALALQQVPLDQQIALELTYCEGLSAPEVARVLGIPENTVYSRLRRAKAHLRSALRQLSNTQDPNESALTLCSATEPKNHPISALEAPTQRDR